MIKNKHKIISVVLCLALVLSSFFALSLTVSAAIGDTVYVRVPGGWSEAHCYMWTDGSGNNGEWPGPKMTATSESGVFLHPHRQFQQHHLQQRQQRRRHQPDRRYGIFQL